MTGGSQQLRHLRRLLRDGATIEAASDQSGIPIEEARLHHADMIENPPPPEDYEPIRPTPKDETMARTARAPKDDEPSEVKTKDFALAVKLYKQDIKPALSKVGEHNQEASSAYKAIKKQCHIQPAAAKVAFKLDGMEEAKRDDFLRCLTGMLAEMRIPLQSADLVDLAEGKVERPKPQLVTLAPHPADDSDLADGGGSDPQDGSDGDEFEAKPEELAKQEGRGKAKPKAGTGAAAIAAMNAAAEAGA